MPALDRYQQNLSDPRNPGAGYHSWVMSTANLGVLAGLSLEQIEQDLRQSNPQRARQRPSEIPEAIRKALLDCGAGGTYKPIPRPEPAVRDGKVALQRIIDQGTIDNEADLWEASPIRLLNDPSHDPILLLETLYKPHDLIWIGDRHQQGIIGETIRTAGEWIKHFRAGGSTSPHIILNPLTGMPATKKTGDCKTYRGDSNVKEFRFSLVEFDALSREDQIRFWSAVKLPIVCLIDSGGKSIHAWLSVSKLAQVKSSGEWGTEIKGRLYDVILTPLGVDGACSNPARLSRLPGHYRDEKSSMQRLLWLATEGITICR
jgi:hypothetical protein